VHYYEMKKLPDSRRKLFSDFMFCYFMTF